MSLIRLISSLFLAFFALPAFADEPTNGGTLVMGLAQTPRHLNPAVQSGLITGTPGAQLFAAPLRYDDDWTPQPYLAKSWQVSDDGLSVTLTLVDNATFHDGTPITSADVAFSLQVIKENHPFKTMFEPVVEVETPTPQIAILKLAKPHPALLLAMSGQLMPIIPQHIYGDGQDIKAHPRNSEDLIGSGPFKLVEFKRDEHVILERYENFFIDGRPYLDKIVMRIIKDPSARAIAMENGELQLTAFENTVRDINRLKKVDHLTTTPDGYSAIGALDWLAFNTANGPTADVRVRQAIAYAIDRNFILKNIMLGNATAAKTGIHPGSPFYDDSVNGYKLDLDKANDLLDEAGYEKDPNGIRFKITLDYGWPSVKPQTEYVKAALKKVGIDVHIRTSPDFPTWAKRISNHDFQMTWDAVFNWGDPVIGVNRTYLSSNIKKGVIWSNTQQYSNEKVDQLLQQAATEPDNQKRKALYKEFQQILAQELPIYWLNTIPYHTVYSNKIGNPPLGIWAVSSPLDKVYLKK